MRPYMSQILLAGGGFGIISSAFMHEHLDHFHYNLLMFGIFSTVMLFGAWQLSNTSN